MKNNCACRPGPGGDDIWIGSLIGKLTIPVASKEIVTGDYEGPYEVIPKAYDDQTLPTYGKTLDNDILVHKVPYYKTSNAAKGLTAYIAEEVS